VKQRVGKDSGERTPVWLAAHLVDGKLVPLVLSCLLDECRIRMQNQELTSMATH
jgi:hypothetical protein